ncbi:MAG: Fic family protein [Gemmatimonadetes bacterium]|nr:Fic family protein [Gemmatimonadota bacterium]
MNLDRTDFIRAMLAEDWGPDAPVAHLEPLPRLSDDAADEASRSLAALGAAELLVALDRTVSNVIEQHGAAGSARLWGVLGSREAVASSHIENEGTSLALGDMRREIELMRFPNAHGVDVQTEAEIEEGHWLAGEKTSVLRCSGASRWLLTSGVSLYNTLRAHGILCFGRQEVKPGQVRRDGDRVVIGDGRGGVSFAPPLGGPEIKEMLRDLVDWVSDRCNQQKADDQLEQYAYRVAVSGIAHLRFETIHPFLDGNGRTGRSFAEAIIASTRPHHHHVLPIGIAMAFSDRIQRSTYYAALDHGRQNQTEFAVWWCEHVEEAAKMAIEEIETDGCFDALAAGEAPA